MKSKFLGVGLFCVILFAAILAGYWDMLNTEKMTLVRDKATNAVGGIADVVRSDSPPAEATPPLDPLAPKADAPPTPASETAALPEAPSPAPEPSAPAAPAAGSPDAAAPKAEPAPPTFDILRVEPDGSTVLAGIAPAGSAVTLRDATGQILGTETADASGAFAVVLDKPLPIGDHQIRIDATTKEGTALTSAETAIVSIPEKGRESELLAMVEAPNQASRLISVPKTFGAPTAVTPGMSPAEPSPAAAQPGPDADRDLSEPAASVETASPSAPAGSGPALAVDAIEIEDDAVYVAGHVTAGVTVRIYIDNRFLAEAGTLPNDRFLLSATSRIGVGEHTVRADALDPSGKVVARVEVPFVKPEGRAMSAISAPSGGTAVPAPAGSTADAVAAAPSTARPDTASASAPGTAGPASTVAGDSAEASASADSAPETRAGAVPTDGAKPTAVSEGASAGAADAGAGAPPTDVAVVRQPALETVNARVIIRRGDTLWRISRNTYGRGARYTVIYLANGDQIRDPNRIYPGQVFRVPEDGSAAVKP